MNSTIKYLNVRLRNAHSTKEAEQRELAKAQSDVAGAQSRIAETDAIIADTEAAIIALGGKVEPVVVIKTLARTKVEGY